MTFLLVTDHGYIFCCPSGYCSSPWLPPAPAHSFSQQPRELGRAGAIACVPQVGTPGLRLTDLGHVHSGSGRARLGPSSVNCQGQALSQATLLSDPARLFLALCLGRSEPPWRLVGGFWSKSSEPGSEGLEAGSCARRGPGWLFRPSLPTPSSSGAMSEREERRFVEIPRESVRLMAESTGLELSDEVAALLAEDVCYRLREATQVCSPSLPACSRLSPPRGRPLLQGRITQVWVQPLLGLRGKATEEASSLPSPELPLSLRGFLANGAGWAWSHVPIFLTAMLGRPHKVMFLFCMRETGS